VNEHDSAILGKRILGELRLRCAFGLEHAVKREEIRKVINRQLSSFTNESEVLSDTALRAIYRELPICACEGGLYIPETAADLEAFRLYMRKKALALFERFKRVADEYPELTGDPGQLKLDV
jgi:hypothetical protein